jgi:hypothetical protein
MTMAGVRFADMRFRPAEFLDFTSSTVEEFEILIPPFKAAFQAHMTLWCLDGTPRTNRRFSVYRTCPLATPEDRLFFLLTYLKTYTLQVVQGRLRWSPWFRQFGSLAKLGSGYRQAANFSVPVAQYASSGVRPASAECGRRAL